MPAPPPPEGTRFKKGQSGNPTGRPPVTRVRKAIRKFKGEAFEAWGLAIGKGEPWAVTLWLHYYYGKPVEKVEHAGEGGGPLVVEIRTLAEPEPEVAAAPEPEATACHARGPGGHACLLLPEHSGRHSWDVGA